MDSPHRKVGTQSSASIDSFLTSLADGLATAQSRLNQNVMGGERGLQRYIYQIPRLDFEFRMHASMDEAGSGEMHFLPVGSSGSRSAQESALLKGSFVAVNVQPSATDAQLAVRAEEASPGTFEVVATITASTGGPLPGIPVHFDLDQLLTDSLNGARQLDVRAGAQFWRAVVPSGEDGVARNLLRLAHDLPAGANIVIRVATETRSRTINFTAR